MSVRIMNRAIPAVVLVCVAQAAMHCLFYRSRAVAHLPWADSDPVVFALPLALGFIVSAVVLWRSGASRSLPRLVGIAALCALTSSYIGITVAFNLYGV